MTRAAAEGGGRNGDSPFGTQGALANARGDFIERIFAVAISVGFASQRGVNQAAAR
jgi:hypothetical protein